MNEKMNFADWMKTVPESLAGDPLWTVEVYRLALFIADVSWHDVTKLMRDQRTRDLSSQLYEAIGSIGANISEGYSRGSGKDRARFYEYALGSARESRTWYYNGRHILGDVVMNHRLNFLTQVIRLLLAMIPDQRGNFLHEESPPYLAKSLNQAPQFPAELLTNVPLP